MFAFSNATRCVLPFQERKSIYLTENADKSKNPKRNLTQIFLLSYAKEIDQITNFRLALKCLHPEFIIDQRNAMKVVVRDNKEESFSELQTRNFFIILYN